jgi:hypothetical protein
MLAADPAQWRFPVLVAIMEPNVIHPIRELTDEEKQKLSDYTKLAMKYRSRFELFKILHRNYEEWWRYIQSLLRSVDGLSEPELLEINRLLMNFMTATKSLIDQVRRYYKQEFKGSPDQDALNDYAHFTKTYVTSCSIVDYRLRNFRGLSPATR